MRDQREREDKRELKLAVQPAANQRGSAKLTPQEFADVAKPATQVPADKACQ